MVETALDFDLSLVAPMEGGTGLRNVGAPTGSREGGTTAAEGVMKSGYCPPADGMRSHGRRIASPS